MALDDSIIIHDVDEDYIMEFQILDCKIDLQLENLKKIQIKVQDNLEQSENAEEEI